MLKRAAVLLFISIVSIEGIGRQYIPESVVGPADRDHHHHSCEQFTQTARFNPYSVTDSIWMTFYYWAAEDDGLTATFLVPTKKVGTVCYSLVQFRAIKYVY